MDITALDKENLPSLLTKFEQCASIINYNRAVALKIVDIIYRKELLQKKDNYTQEHLSFLKEKHQIEDPWNYSTKDLLETLYPFFSWSQYVKFGYMLEKLDLQFTSKLSEGALTALYRVRENIHTLVPYLEELGKEVLTKEDVDEAKEINLRRIPRPSKKVKDILITIPKDMLDKVKIKELTKGYREFMELSKSLEKKVKTMKIALDEVTSERNELRMMVGQYQNELKRWGSRRG